MHALELVKTPRKVVGRGKGHRTVSVWLLPDFPFPWTHECFFTPEEQGRVLHNPLALPHQWGGGYLNPPHGLEQRKS